MAVPQSSCLSSLTLLKKIGQLFSQVSLPLGLRDASRDWTQVTHFDRAGSVPTGLNADALT